MDKSFRALGEINYFLGEENMLTMQFGYIKGSGVPEPGSLDKAAVHLFDRDVANGITIREVPIGMLLPILYGATTQEGRNFFQNVLDANRGLCSPLELSELRNYSHFLSTHPRSLKVHIAHEPYLPMVEADNQQTFMKYQAARILLLDSVLRRLGLTPIEQDGRFAEELKTFSLPVRAAKPVGGEIDLHQYRYCPQGHIFIPDEKKGHQTRFVRRFFIPEERHPEELFDREACEEHPSLEARVYPAPTIETILPEGTGGFKAAYQME
ncbi:hypothetical protein HYU14_06530 [Candidatus Woesearchaeota archaeon]|nr:hypothetical protein [Candidatus Woesearchaeota archaeon]